MGSTSAARPVLFTALILGLVFVADVWLMENLGGGILSIVVGAGGCVALLVAAIWAGLRGRGAVARNRVLTAGVYLFLAAAAVGVLRHRASALAEFHSHLSPGKSVLEVLRKADELYARHPRRWRFVAVWGTVHEFAIEDATAAARAPDNVSGATWYANAPRSVQELESLARALATAEQIWFTFRTGTGFLHFFVRLDKNGRVESVSEVTGHQS